jgi:hypothetical protein
MPLSKTKLQLIIEHVFANHGLDELTDYEVETAAADLQRVVNRLNTIAADRRKKRGK